MRTSMGLVGCGVWGRNILRDLLTLGCEVVVADPCNEQRDLAIENGASAALPTIDEMPAVAGIIVATPATTHAVILERLLDRGVPIFTEKPFTTDAHLAEQLTAMGEGRIFVMDVWRYHHGIEALAGIARSGELGEVRMLRSTRSNWTSPRKDTDTTWTLLPHDLSICLEIFGHIPEPRCATAETSGDRAVGMIAVLGTRPQVVVEVSNRYFDKRREVRLHCENGVAVMRDTDCGFIEIARDPADSDESRAEVEQRPVGREPALLRELRSFVEHLQGGPAPKSSAAEGLEIVRAIDRLRSLAQLR